MHSLTLIGEIGESDFFTYRISFQDVETALAQLPDDGEPLDVLGMSGGGDWYASAAIRQRLEAEAQRRPLTFHVYGVAASGMAHIVIGTRGARVEMARDAMLKIHGSWSVTAGGSAEHAYEAEATARINGLMADAIAHRAPSIDRDEMARTLTERSPAIWSDYTAAEAVEVGLADGILETEDPKIVAQVEEAGAEAPETQTDQGDQAMKVSLPRSTAPMAGTPPESPAQTTAPAAQASVDEEGLFQRVLARVRAAMPGATTPQAPAARVAQITEPPPATDATAVPVGTQAALPFPMAVAGPPAADPAMVAMTEANAQQCAAATFARLGLPVTMAAERAHLGALHLQEAQAHANACVARAGGDAVQAAACEAHYSAAQAATRQYAATLEANARMLKAAAAPLTTQAAAAPAAVTTENDGDPGVQSLAAATAKMLAARGLVTAESLAKTAEKYPELAVMATAIEETS